jgi:hypothetical protein
MENSLWKRLWASRKILKNKYTMEEGKQSRKAQHVTGLV